MYSHITLLALVLQVAVFRSSECHCPLVLKSNCGLTGEIYNSGIPSAGICDAYPYASGLIGGVNVNYPNSILSGYGIIGALPTAEGGPVLSQYGLPAGAGASGLYDSGYLPQCVRHQVMPVFRQVVGECLINVPVIKKNIRHQTETYTRHVPISERLITQQEEKYVHHVPVVKKLSRNVVEYRTRHVPVIKSRTRTVVEPYTTHVPITEKYNRAVLESVTKNVPVVERRCRPVVRHTTRLVPVLEKRIRPIVESRYVNVPVRRRYIKNIVEQRVRSVTGPCPVCPSQSELTGNAASYPAGMSSGAYTADMARDAFSAGIGAEAYPSGIDASATESDSYSTGIDASSYQANLSVENKPASITSETHSGVQEYRSSEDTADNISGMETGAYPSQARHNSCPYSLDAHSSDSSPVTTDSGEYHPSPCPQEHHPAPCACY